MGRGRKADIPNEFNKLECHDSSPGSGASGGTARVGSGSQPSNPYGYQAMEPVFGMRKTPRQEEIALLLTGYLKA